MITAENFKKFLIITNNYNKYINNVVEQSGRSFTDITRIYRNEMHNIIDCSLNWASCPEGSMYWSNLNQHWKSTISNNVFKMSGCKSIW